MKLDRIFIVLLICFFSFMNIIYGGIGNFIAVKNNGGLMPVLSGYEYKTDEHFSFQDKNEINSYFFVDRFNINHHIYSIGDFLMMFGSLGLFISTFFICRDVVLYKKGKLIIRREDGNLQQSQ